MLARLRQFCKDDKGSYALITAVLLPAFIGTIGLGTEAGLWYFKHLSMQEASDSAALSAAVAYDTNNSISNLRTEADGVAASYNFVPGSNGTTLTVNFPPKSGSHISTAGAIEVIITQPQSRIFSTLWSTAVVNVTARAVAVAGNNGLGCILSLDGSASGATTAQGSTSVALNGCSLYDNSNSSTALTVGGSASVSAATVDVVGGISGLSNISSTGGSFTGVGSINDPYSGVTPAPFSGCDQTNFTAKSTVTIDPGVYCGGMKLNAGAVVTLNPGTYYIDQGSLTVNGGATLQGTGVTIVLTSSTGSNYATVSIAGGATINLTAPTSGPTAGIVIYGDRNMPIGTTLKFTGGSSQIFGGAIYAPEASVSFSGGSGTSTACTQLIADTITFTGDSHFAINCTGYGTQAFGPTRPTLVE